MTLRATDRFDIAELAWAWHRAGVNSIEERDAVAATLGLVRDKVETTRSGGTRNARTGEEDDDAPPTETTFLRIVEFKPREEREPVRLPEPVAQEEGKQHTPPAPRRADIVPWPRLWAWLAGRLTDVTDGDPDVDAWVERMSRGLPVERIPRLPLYRAATRIACLEDWSWRLIPFWRDMDDVALRLKRIFRRTLSRRILHGGPDGSAAEAHDDDLRDAGPLEPGCPVLALSDLGALERRRARDRGELSPAEAAWLRHGEALRSRGHALHALVPGPAAMVNPRVARVWNPEPWDRRSRVLPSPDARERRAERLLTLASPASRIEGAYLRDLRTILGHDADLLTEADAFLHEKIDDTFVSVQGLEPATADRLRRRWREGAGSDEVTDEQARGAADAMRRWHHRMPEEIRHEETLRLHATRPDLVEPWELDDARAFFGELLREVREGERRDGLAAWFDGFDERNESFGYDPMLSAILTELTERLRPNRDQARLPPDVRPPPPRGEVRSQWLRQRGGMLSVEDVDTDETSPEAGSMLATVRQSQGLWLDHGGARSEPLPADGEWQVPLGGTRAGSIRIHSDQGSWIVESLTRPEWASSIGVDPFGLWADIEIKRVHHRLRWIPPGRFQMGSPEDEQGRFDNETQHEVFLTRGYWLGETPVTQELYEALVGRNPSRFRTPDRPVENVTWDDAVAFTDKLRGELPDVSDGLSWRLPTEAEWEHACRAGTTTSTYAGELRVEGEHNAPLLDAIAWYGGNSGVGYDLDEHHDSSGWPNKQYDHARAGTRPVKEPRRHLDDPRDPRNAFGLHDMLGNVWEWCMDWHGAYPRGTATDPSGPAQGSYRVLRGGSWILHAQSCRSAQRPWWLWHDAGVYDYVGFRLARGPGVGSSGAERG